MTRFAKLSRGIAEANRENRYATRRTAPVAPLPEDPTQCRWCGGRLKVIEPGGKQDFCQSGCAKNDVEPPPYFGFCLECKRDFHTGKRRALLCWECTEKELDVLAHRQKVEEDLRFAAGANDYTAWRRRQK